MTVLSDAALAVAAGLVSVASLAAAPFLLALSETVRLRLANADAPSPLLVWRRAAALLATGGVREPGEGALLAGAVLAAFAATAVAALAVPGYATGTPLTRLADLPTLGALLVLARLASLVAVFAPGRAGPAAAAPFLPLAAVGVAPVLLPIASAATGAGRLDALPAALAGAHGAVVLLLAAALLLAAFADTDNERHLAAALSGPLLLLAEATAALRLLVWVDLVGLVLLPGTLADAGGGPLASATALLLWALRSAALAAALGVARAVTGPLRMRSTLALLGTAALLALLAAVLVCVDQSFA
jgi:hypothetical protein